MYNVFFFFIVPFLLVGLYIVSNLYPGISKFMGDTGTLITFLTAIFTYIYVVLTGLTVRQMVKNSEDESRPYIIADIEINDHCVFFIIRNIGKLPAKELKVKIEPDIVNTIGKSLNTTLFSKPISIVAPGKEIKTFINTSMVVFKSEAPKVFEVALEYKWGNAKVENESYRLDISMYHDLVTVNVKSIHHVAKELEEISKNFKKVIKYNSILVKSPKDIAKEEKENREYWEQRSKEIKGLEKME
jgi:hypothetical protein